MNQPQAKRYKFALPKEIPKVQLSDQKVVMTAYGLSALCVTAHMAVLIEPGIIKHWYVPGVVSVTGIGIGLYGKVKQNEDIQIAGAVLTGLSATLIPEMAIQNALTPLKTKAALLKSNLEGTIEWFMRIGGALPVVAATALTLRHINKPKGAVLKSKLKNHFETQGSLAMDALSKTKPFCYFIKEEEVPLAQNVDVVLCKDVKTGQDVVIPGKDRFLHCLITGPTGTGKTSLVIKQKIYQDMLRIMWGQPLGISVLEPSGDLAEWTAETAYKLGIPFTHVDPEKDKSHVYNPMEGHSEYVAETTRKVLKSMFGKQEAFFGLIQEVIARNTVLLLKRVHGDNLDFLSIMRTLRNPDELKANVAMYIQKVKRKDDLAEYFEIEVFGAMEKEIYKFATGLRTQLADLGTNEMLTRIMQGRSNINLDNHLEKGGHVFAVNSALGPLGKLGDSFGMFLMLNIQSAVFRRKGTENTRTPHFLYVDEFPRYVNEDFINQFLPIARKYRCGTVLAIQTLDQLITDNGGQKFKKITLTNCRNRIWFNGLSEEDAKFVEKDCGMDEVDVEQKTYDHHPIAPTLWHKGYRVTPTDKPRFPYTYIKELEPKHIIYQIVSNMKIVKPGEGVCEWLPEIQPVTKKEPLPQDNPEPIVFLAEDEEEEEILFINKPSASSPTPIAESGAEQQPSPVQSATVAKNAPVEANEPKDEQTPSESSEKTPTPIAALPVQPSEPMKTVEKTVKEGVCPECGTPTEVVSSQYGDYEMCPCGYENKI